MLSRPADMQPIMRWQTEAIRVQSTWILSLDETTYNIRDTGTVVQIATQPRFKPSYHLSIVYTHKVSWHFNSRVWFASKRLPKKMRSQFVSTEHGSVIRRLILHQLVGEKISAISVEGESHAIARRDFKQSEIKHWRNHFSIKFILSVVYNLGGWQPDSAPSSSWRNRWNYFKFYLACCEISIFFSPIVSSISIHFQILAQYGTSEIALLFQVWLTWVVFFQQLVWE